MSSPIFMGFRAKEPWRPDPHWWPAVAGHVEHVCSVSDCLCEAPPGLFERWDFNRAFCYGTEAEALATVPADREGNFTLFAYWLMPVALDAGGLSHSLELDDHFVASGEPLPADPGRLSDYDVIGYDIVGTQGQQSFGFACSPLSCNSLAKRITVNRFCLVDQLEAALEVARAWNHDELPSGEIPEPGNYIVVKVAMKRGAHSGRPSSL